MVNELGLMQNRQIKFFWQTNLRYLVFLAQCVYIHTRGAKKIK